MNLGDAIKADIWAWIRDRYGGEATAYYCPYVPLMKEEQFYPQTTFETKYVKMPEIKVYVDSHSGPDDPLIVGYRGLG